MILQQTVNGSTFYVRLLGRVKFSLEGYSLLTLFLQDNVKIFYKKIRFNQFYKIVLIYKIIFKSLISFLKENFV